MKIKPLKQRERKHRAIISAAKITFLNKGFELSSMDEIAEIANVSKRTVYDHFSDKKNLFIIMLQEHWAEIMTLDKPLFSNKKTLRENLKCFAKTFFTFLYQPATIDIFRLLIAETKHFPNLLDKLLINGAAPFTKALTDFLYQRMQAGELPINDPKHYAGYFIGLLKEPHFWPMMLGFTKEQTVKNKNKFINDAVEFFLKACN